MIRRLVGFTDKIKDIYRDMEEGVGLENCVNIDADETGMDIYYFNGFSAVERNIDYIIEDNFEANIPFDNIKYFADSNREQLNYKIERGELYVSNSVGDDYTRLRSVDMLYPSPFSLDEDNMLELKVRAYEIVTILQEMIDYIEDASSESKVSSGINVNFDKDTGDVKFFASNSTSITEVKFGELKQKPLDDRDYFLPIRTMREIVRLYTDNAMDVLTISIDDNYIRIDNEVFKYYSKLNYSGYPDVEYMTDRKLSEQVVESNKDNFIHDINAIKGTVGILYDKSVVRLNVTEVNNRDYIEISSINEETKIMHEIAHVNEQFESTGFINTENIDAFLGIINSFSGSDTFKIHFPESEAGFYVFKSNNVKVYLLGAKLNNDD